MTVQISGNSPRCGEYCFPEGASLGQVFAEIGPAPRQGFRASHILVLRRWFNVKPHSIEFDMIKAPSWRDFPLFDRDCIIYQYDLDAAANPITNGRG